MDGGGVTIPLITRTHAGAILEPFVYTFDDNDGNPIDLAGMTAKVSWKRWSTGETGEFAVTAINTGTGTVTFSVPAAVTAVRDTVDLMVWAGNGATLRMDGARWRLIIADPPGTAPTI